MKLKGQKINLAAQKICKSTKKMAKKHAKDVFLKKGITALQQIAAINHGRKKKIRGKKEVFSYAKIRGRRLFAMSHGGRRAEGGAAKGSKAAQQPSFQEEI